MPRYSSGPGLASLLLLALHAQSALAQVPQTSVDAPALRRIDLETHTPVRVLTRQDFAQQSHLGLGEVLQRLPFMSGSAVNLNSNAEGDGSVAADIGGFGRARCIVMLNGHRLPTNELLAAPAVDLDAIPLAAVERIEIFLGGASPAWGADAVAGVINIITRAEADGADLSVSSARSGHGDAAAQRASIFGGRVFGRGYIDAAFDYHTQNPIYSAARDFSARSQALGCLEGPDCLWPFGSTLTPAGVFLLDRGNAFGLPAGRYTLDGEGGYRPFVSKGPTNDLYSTQGDSFLRAGRSGFSTSARASYELSSTMQLDLDVLLSNDRTDRQLAALPLTTALNGATAMYTSSVISLSPVRVSAANFYNPFGIEVPEVRRRLVELGPRSLTDQGEMRFAALTLRHAGQRWQLEGALSHGRSEVSEHISDVVQDQRLSLALGPSGRDASGNIRCGTPNPATGLVDDPIEACVPLDLFHGPGSITPAMLGYIATSRTDVARLNLTQASLIARREIATGSGAPAQLAIGWESRSLNAYFSLPDYELDGQRYSQSTGGSVAQHDLIAELVWPFHAHDGAAPSTLSAGGRFTRFSEDSMIGTAFAAATWRIQDDWLLRSRFTQVYRAPSTGELFLGQRQTIVTIGDLCGLAMQNSTVCSQAGIVSSSTDIASDSLFVVGGNPFLKPEYGYSASGGIVWNSPERRERFVALDATWTRLNDAIRSPSISEVITACAQSLVTCAGIRSTADGSAYQIDRTLINGGRDESARLDLELRDGGSVLGGNWRAELFSSYLLRRQLVDINGNRLNLRGTFDVVQSVTGVAYPTLEAQARLRWSRGPWAAEWSTQYIGSYDEVRDRNGWIANRGGSIRTVSAAIYHDLGLAWSVKPEWTVRFSLENVFDRDPPFVNNGFDANTDASTYRVEGRMLVATIDTSF